MRDMMVMHAAAVASMSEAQCMKALKHEAPMREARCAMFVAAQAKMQQRRRRREAKYRKTKSAIKKPGGSRAFVTVLSLDADHFASFAIWCARRDTLRLALFL
jgi:hypothetical protein